MGVILSVESIVLALLVFAGLVSMWAHGRGHNWAVAFLVSFFLSPITGLIVYAILGDKAAAKEAQRRADDERAREHERQLESLRAVTSAVAGPARADAGAAPSVAAELEHLGALLDCGLLTKDEFDAQKAKLLSQ